MHSCKAGHRSNTYTPQQSVIFELSSQGAADEYLLSLRGWTSSLRDKAATLQTLDSVDSKFRANCPFVGRRLAYTS